MDTSSSQAAPSKPAGRGGGGKRRLEPKPAAVQLSQPAASQADSTEGSLMERLTGASWRVQPASPALLD